MPDAVDAVVPGHVTLFFSVYEADDPARTGSRGVGFTLDEPVSVRVSPGTGQVVNGDDRTIDSVDRVLDALDVGAAVEISTTLPMGTGFGVSGAAALGTALAANRCFERGRTERDLVRVAHVAEVEAGTGLGDVVAQAHGGLVLRLEPGVPPHGRIRTVDEDRPVEFLALGELSTQAVIGGETGPISRAGERALEAIRDEPSLPRAFELGRAFAHEAGLLEADVGDVLDSVADTGGSAAMGMLGRTVVALDEGLSAAGYDATSTAVSNWGARLAKDA